jgi:hypothetical protein
MSVLLLTHDSIIVVWVVSISARQRDFYRELRKDMRLLAVCWLMLDRVELRTTSLLSIEEKRNKDYIHGESKMNPAGSCVRSE